MKSSFSQKSSISFCLLLLTILSQSNTFTVPPPIKALRVHKRFPPNLKKSISKQLASRHFRARHTARKLDGRGIFNGSNLGLVGLGYGVHFGFKDRAYQEEKIKAITQYIKGQMNQFFVLNRKNQDFYHEMDGHLTELEGKIESLSDSATQKISEFDLRVRSKLAGRAFMPLISYL